MDNKSLSSLIDNAFDFLEKGISEFEHEPKYSVINFCAAVELLLKARLVHEHWSLVVVTPPHPNIASFRTGDFKSITFTDIIPRIEAVIGETIPKDAIRAFSNLAKHRNKMIHFFHEAHADETKKQLEEIVREQCTGWFYLRRLLEKWDNVFSAYTERINAVNARMKKHQVYLNEVFVRISPELEIERKKGAIFAECRNCSFEAAEEFKKTEYLHDYKCLVCLFADTIINIPCTAENCTNIIGCNMETGIDIMKCKDGHEVTREEISNLLDTSPATYDNHTNHVTKNCVMCGERGDVVEHGDYFVCVDCFFITDDIEYCKWCDEGEIGGGDLENSYYHGCNFCYGREGS